jgi:hypothetical protein
VNAAACASIENMQDFHRFMLAKHSNDSAFSALARVALPLALKMIRAVAAQEPHVCAKDAMQDVLDAADIIKNS